MAAMQSSRVTWGCGVLALGVSLFGACEDDDAQPGQSPGAQAGAAGEPAIGPGGAGGSAGKGGQVAGGDGGRGGADGLNEVDACQRPLASYCAPGSPIDPCNVTLTEACHDQGDVNSHYSVCGGTIVDSDHGTYAETWAFDAQGTLVGYRFDDDTPHDCRDGTSSFTTIYGTFCADAPLGGLPCDDEGPLGGAGGGGAGPGGAAGVGGVGGVGGAP
jgi:hypothetical protein